MESTEWFTSTMMYYFQWEKGYLPEPGGINQQPAKFPELVQHICHIMGKVDEIQREEAIRKAKSKDGAAAGKKAPAKGRAPPRSR